eukprot:CAMPEP_0195095840 /NCGR_PEP_ID=MMETSP0448-20130528/48968_1 /TAXON_ID=66468 /ORGANISM="Heterocapsa triquestra, Strain CCMP 448" /LENGTH=100 /DNA_ID=CAMNT_0040130129 /DNA_START=66 /DNA_END=369 /DNA_ORIENTATION=-
MPTPITLTLAAARCQAPNCSWMAVSPAMCALPIAARRSWGDAGVVGAPIRAGQQRYKAPMDEHGLAEAFRRASTSPRRRRGMRSGPMPLNWLYGASQQQD